MAVFTATVFFPGDLLVSEHKFGHRAIAVTQALCPGAGRVLTGFCQYPLFLLSLKLLKHQLQFCRREHRGSVQSTGESEQCTF